MNQPAPLTSSNKTDAANSCAIIPARGGSKGIPLKNLMEVCGKPLLVWTIEAALAARSIHRVIVSTDDSEIARVARKAGAEVITRPSEISGDQASSEQALLHALDQLEQEKSGLPELTVFLQCTSPLTLPEDIDGTVEALLAEQSETALSVTPFHYFLWEQSATGDAVGINHDKSVRLLRQQRKPEYVETGAVYVMRTASFREKKHRFFGKTALYVMPSERCHEIDDPVDLKVAEMLLAEQLQRRQRQVLPPEIHAVVFDFDGVFTNNKVIVDQEGTESVVCDRSDGLGLEQLRKTGIPLLVISKEKNSVVQARCGKLKIPVLQGIDEKLPRFTAWCEEQGFSLDNVIYVGNDANDVTCLRAAGCGVAVSDAHTSAKAAANFILNNSGGNGAIRELTDLILQQTNG